jgi:phytanoyl-CoA hydroxylase
MNATTDADVESYRRDGYLIVPDLLAPAECAALRAESVAVCRGERGPVEGLEAVMPGESEPETMARYMVCVMVHKLDSAFAATLHDPRIVSVLTRLIGPDVKAVHSQLYFKHAGMPGNAWHQDELFLPTRDRSLVTAWIAMEDANVANGCLKFIAGSHRPSVLWPMRRHNHPDLDRAEEAYGFPQDPASAVPIELRSGSVVFFDGYVLHGSYPNRKREGFRRSLLNVYCSAHSTLAFDPTSYQPSVKDYRDIVMVAGSDPYAWKGTVRLGRPYVRKAGATKADLELAARS